MHLKAVVSTPKYENRKQYSSYCSLNLKPVGSFRDLTRVQAHKASLKIQPTSLRTSHAKVDWFAESQAVSNQSQDAHNQSHDEVVEGVGGQKPEFFQT